MIISYLNSLWTHGGIWCSRSPEELCFVILSWHNVKCHGTGHIAQVSLHLVSKTWSLFCQLADWLISPEILSYMMLEFTIQRAVDTPISVLRHYSYLLVCQPHPHQFTESLQRVWPCFTQAINKWRQYRNVKWTSMQKRNRRQKITPCK